MENVTILFIFFPTSALSFLLLCDVFFVDPSKTLFATFPGCTVSILRGLW